MNYLLKILKLKMLIFNIFILLTAGLVQCIPLQTTPKLNKIESFKIKSSSTPSTWSTIPIIYRGGPTMTNGNVYVIWYGSWTATQKSLVKLFSNGVSNTTWWNSQKTYGSTNVVYKSDISNNYTMGKALTGQSISDLVYSAINTKLLPEDSAGIYFVATSTDVLVDGYCTQFCGWHSYFNYNANVIKYSFVGNTNQCPYACSGQQTVSPNRDPGVDGMMSILAHELVETMSDPMLNAWYDDQGAENADKCAWQFDKTYTLPSSAGTGKAGAKWNVKASNKNFLIQMNWNSILQTCKN